ncbi:MAG: hypothetical protein HUU55_07545 [Myxococcales bacterium]|nr:hypothetical protein [Myxococcales bacterium]
MKNDLVPYVRVPAFYAGTTECTNRHCKQEFPRVRLLRQGHVGLCAACWEHVSVHQRCAVIEYDHARANDINLSTGLWLVTMMQCIDEAEDASERGNSALVRTNKRWFTNRCAMVVDEKRRSPMSEAQPSGIAPRAENPGS